MVTVLFAWLMWEPVAGPSVMMAFSLTFELLIFRRKMPAVFPVMRRPWRRRAGASAPDEPGFGAVQLLMRTMASPSVPEKSVGLELLGEMTTG